MSSAEAFKAAMDELRAEQAKAIQQHRQDAAQLADLTAKLNAGINGDPNVDIAAMVAEVHAAAVSLRDGIASTHTDALAPQTANAGTSVVQGGGSTSADVVSASSPGVIVPPASGTEASSAVPETLGGGAMARQDATAADRAPGTPLPAKDGEELKVAEPPVPSVEDVPSGIHDDVPDSAKKG